MWPFPPKPWGPQVPRETHWVSVMGLARHPRLMRFSVLSTSPWASLSGPWLRAGPLWSGGEPSVGQERREPEPPAPLPPQPQTGSGPRHLLPVPLRPEVLLEVRLSGRPVQPPSLPSGFRLGRGHECSGALSRSPVSCEARTLSCVRTAVAGLGLGATVGALGSLTDEALRQAGSTGFSASI